MLSRKTHGGNGEHHPYGDIVRARRRPVGGWLTLVPRWPAFFMPVPDLAHRQLAWPPYVHIVGRALRGAACRSNDPRRNRSLPAFAGKRSTSRIGSSQLREKNNIEIIWQGSFALAAAMPGATRPLFSGPPRPRSDASTSGTVRIGLRSQNTWGFVSSRYAQARPRETGGTRWMFAPPYESWMK